MSEDAAFLANYLPDKLYTHPGKNGVYASIAAEGEEVIGEIDVTIRCKVAVSAFWVHDRSDFGTFKITKLTFHQRYGWREDSHIHVNHFQLAQIKEFLSIISNLNLSEARKARISLDNVNIGALGALLGSSKGAELVRELARTPELHQDIYAVAAKRRALAEFQQRMGTDLPEKEWQAFFEANQWIFGHGLHYVSLDSAADTLMARTTGSEFDQRGKTADALMRTRAEVSQFVFVEIKKDTTELLRRGDAYRPGCWGVSAEVSNAVTQVQKTTFEFARKRFRVALKDDDGNDTGETAYSVEPRSYLIIGDTKELRGNDDKIACFELYRRNIRAPEILTFDELLYRARFIVQNLTRNAEA
ncbi:Shedu immune nuclease family protein [Caulobacter sp. KR2-114]|uniref:Shedu immune nuclease family protein n=1 Tax=Caulobacter sp. KR2-114 TaxID=3400912 RepID=UPI003C024DC5